MWTQARAGPREFRRGSLTPRPERPPSHPILSVWIVLSLSGMMCFSSDASACCAVWEKLLFSGFTQTCIISLFHPKAQPKKRVWPLLLPLWVLSDWVWKHSCPCLWVLQGSSSHCSYIFSFPRLSVPPLDCERGIPVMVWETSHKRVGRDPLMGEGHGIPGGIPILSGHSSHL